MAIKMRYLYFSGKKKIAALGEHVKQKFGLNFNAVDVIPPAYSCDKERIVILAVSAKDELDDKLRLFARELTKVRAQNVAVIVDGNQKAADALVSTLKEAGTNVVGEVLYIKGGMPIFGGKPTEEELAALDKWLDGVVASLA